ncbi:Hpt domain-containing protein [uncultured Dechloromonas sp.]|uniref:Hpt domain-containing protein n=1 Tax=uncultured Dechloromonas sp. TaxID=171719 RepID=UPI0025F31D0E|nr:Hpt domain-containing protein [uncultured Dechloromonas sp.]
MSENGFPRFQGGYCNLDYLLQNLGRNEETAKRLAGLFLENYPGLLERMMQALRAGDRPALKNALHDIRSSCVLFSGHHCVDIARRFEESLREHASQAEAMLAKDDWELMAETLCNCLSCMASEMKAYFDGSPA